MSAWLLLLLAILFEVAGTTFMKFSNGFERLMPSTMMAICYIFSIIFLAYAVKKIDISVAYAIWAGLGTMLISIIGVYFFKEGISGMKFFGIVFVIAGVVLLNLSSNKA